MGGPGLFLDFASRLYYNISGNAATATYHHHCISNISVAFSFKQIIHSKRNRVRTVRTGDAYPSLSFHLEKKLGEQQKGSHYLSLCKLKVIFFLLFFLFRLNSDSGRDAGYGLSKAKWVLARTQVGTCSQPRSLQPGNINHLLNSRRPEFFPISNDQTEGKNKKKTKILRTYTLEK